MKQSEIEFILGLVLDHELDPVVKKKCLTRIRDVEKYLRLCGPQQSWPQAALSRPAMAIAPSTAQAPSTQRILDANPLPPTGIPPAQRIIGGEVNTGNGTKGPRKF